MEKQIETLIREALFYYEEEGLIEGDIAEVTALETFENTGLLTSDCGVVLMVKDLEGNRKEFQITVKRSR